MKTLGAMMSKRGFSLLEMMIALAVSSFIMLGMIQSYRNALNTLKNARELLVINRKIALLFNQLERDITTIITYQKRREIKQDKKNTGKKGAKDKQDDQGAVGYGEAAGKSGGSDKPGADPSEKELDPGSNPGTTASPKNKKKKKLDQSGLSGKIFDDSSFKYQSKKYELFKKISFICTNPLSVYGETSQRIVRVGYELVPDTSSALAKEKKRTVYKLVRKQTDNRDNYKFTEKDESAGKVQSYTVADNVKSISLEYSYKEKKEKKKQAGASSDNSDNTSDKSEEILKSFTWSKKEWMTKSATPLPEYMTLLITLWDDSFEKEFAFEALIPLCIHEHFVPVREKFDKKENNKKKKGGGDEK